MNSTKSAINRQQLFQVQAYSRQHLTAIINAQRKPHHITEVLSKIIYLIFLKSNKSKQASAYCSPSMKWLGEQIGRSDETAQRAVQFLTDQGLIFKIIRRKMKDGRWLTNAYYPGKILNQIMARILGQRKSTPPPSVSHDRQIPKPILNDSLKGVGEEFIDKIKRLNALLTGKEVI